MDTIKDQKGLLAEYLGRGNKQIREGRALIIYQNTEKVLRRRIEDLQDQLDRTNRNSEDLLDLSPENSTSLILSANYKPEELIDKYIDFGLEARNLEIKLDVARQSYRKLFGKLLPAPATEVEASVEEKHA